MDSAVSRSRGSSTASTASTTSITSETVLSAGAPNPKSRTADLGSSAIVSAGAGAALGDSVVLGLKTMKEVKCLIFYRKKILM